ncbi:Rieske 2Fe-2S domain-containing protein [Kocuria sp. LUK]|uniref:cytochrome bc1 complex Rieske iron-sulfur subunit n=1 Tax=Kocuria sp. LUK TaxID=2897828 RepID=UPI001E2CE2C5|nr:Rieske 2Fe-2S domain-containing protein [Kocuria sp. LUK]MCD1143801.1 Rieske 2Fe-2S domain-containing protein [Kocuria sp. LUK]
MGSHSDGTPHQSGTVATTGTTEMERFPDPGLPPHRPRLTDIDERAAKRAERQVVLLFLISVLGSVLFFVGYFGIQIDGAPKYDVTDPSGSRALQVQNLLLGLGIALGMFGIGIGVVHWARTLMPDHELVESRHAVRTEEQRADAQEILTTIYDESGIKRRPLLRNTLIGAAVVAPLPFIGLLKDLGPTDLDVLKHTLWDEGVRLVRDPSGTPIKASDVTLGSTFHVVPENLAQIGHNEGYLDEKAKAVVLLMRLDPDSVNVSPERQDWNVDGIFAYSKVCTHVGCPVALYEQQTHHLLCPCHQSTFDLTNECEVIFGPAARPLPQLPITVDAEGYLVARSDFTEPVGPTYSQRGTHVEEMQGEAN